MLNSANLLTCLRIVLILPFLLMIDSGRYGMALGIFFLASLTDFADGYVARTFGLQTRLGRLLDPLADKALITCAYLVMAIPHDNLPSIPIWLAVVVVGRDLLILAGALLIDREEAWRGGSHSEVAGRQDFASGRARTAVVEILAQVNQAFLLDPQFVLQDPTPIRVASAPWASSSSTIARRPCATAPRSART